MAARMGTAVTGSEHENDRQEHEQDFELTQRRVWPWRCRGRRLGGARARAEGAAGTDVGEARRTHVDCLQKGDDAGDPSA
jgi:hypothetical protein